MSGWERIPFLPRGELHGYDSCAFCGAKASKIPLRQATLPTYAAALVCVDPCDCERRRYRLRHGISESPTGRWTM